MRVPGLAAFSFRYAEPRVAVIITTPRGLYNCVAVGRRAWLPNCTTNAPMSPTTLPLEIQGVARACSFSNFSNIDMTPQQEAVTMNFMSSHVVHAAPVRKSEQDAIPDTVSFVLTTALKDRSPSRRENYTPREMSTLHGFANTIMPTLYAGFANTGSRLGLQLRDLVKMPANELCQKMYRQAGFDSNRP